MSVRDKHLRDLRSAIAEIERLIIDIEERIAETRRCVGTLREMPEFDRRTPGRPFVDIDNDKRGRHEDIEENHG